MTQPTRHSPASILAPALRQVGVNSFTEFLGQYAPEALLNVSAQIPGHDGNERHLAPHGTTIVAATFDGGVVMAGDRRATMGHVIAQRDIDKVFPADEFSCIGIAGTAGIAVELTRIFQVELEHYEKIEGRVLSLDGKANRLSGLLRGHLSLALQGLAVVPLFAGFDLEQQRGRIFSYDLTGGRYEEQDFYSVGSGALFARGSLKKLYGRARSEDLTVLATLEALYDAADDDAATGGPDLTRGIVPKVAVVDQQGYRALPQEQLRTMVEQVLAARMQHPDGPTATLTQAEREEL